MAGIVGRNDVSVGIALNFAIAVVIGASFGLLFQREIFGLGSSVVCGVGYGLLWWFVGPLTLLPALSHRPIDWTVANAALLFGSLVGHLIYGMIVGTLYGLEDRAWKRFFYESDHSTARRSAAFERSDRSGAARSQASSAAPSSASSCSRRGR